MQPPSMNTFTVVATGITAKSADEVEVAVRRALAEACMELVACDWAPDPDTISDVVGEDVTVIDLN